MSKKDRSLANSRAEAQRIYYQRREILRLQQENTNLKQRIDKAIEYIDKESSYYETYRGILDNRNVNYLLEILKGEKVSKK